MRKTSIRLAAAILGAFLALSAPALAQNAMPMTQNMMGGGMMGPGMMGPGMMGPGMMGSGMMGPGMMGPGMMQDMMGGGMMGASGAFYLPPQRAPLSVEEAKASFEAMLSRWDNPNIRLGKIKETNADTLEAEIVTKDGSLVERYSIDRRSWLATPVR